MSNQINYTLTDNTITVYDEDFVPFSIDSSHPNYSMTLKCLQNQEQSLATLNYVLELMKPIESVKRKVSGTSIVVSDDTLYYNGEQLHGVIVDRILAAKGSVDHLIKFLDKLMLNPSHRVVNQLYSFLEASGNAITKEGNFVAYKIVNQGYKDLYTRSMDNSPGVTVSVPRNKVDEDPDRTCSNGLHVCGFHYLSSYGSVRSGTDRVVSVVVDPMNVVAVPRDYNNNKMRVCEYTVLADITDKVKGSIGTPVGLSHTLSYETYDPSASDYDNYFGIVHDGTWIDVDVWPDPEYEGMLEVKVFGPEVNETYTKVIPANKADFSNNAIIEWRYHHEKDASWDDDPWFNDDSEWEEDGAYYYDSPEERAYLNGEWVKHTTEGMPEWVDGDDLIHVRLASGWSSPEGGGLCAGVWSWYLNGAYSITEYRLAE